MAYISRRDCAKAAAYALASNDYHHAILNINGPEAMTISQFIEIGNSATGHHVSYQAITDEQNYQVFDAMGEWEFPGQLTASSRKIQKLHSLVMVWSLLVKRSGKAKWVSKPMTLSSWLAPNHLP